MIVVTPAWLRGCTSTQEANTTLDTNEEPHIMAKPASNEHHPPRLPSPPPTLSSTTQSNAATYYTQHTRFQQLPALSAPTNHRPQQQRPVGPLHRATNHTTNHS